MILIGIDIGKLSHTFCIMDKYTGELIIKPTNIKNDKNGFDLLLDKVKLYDKTDLLFGMEDTGHYHFALLKTLLSRGYTVALINPIATDLTRKLQGGVSKNDELDTITICLHLRANL